MWSGERNELDFFGSTVWQKLCQDMTTPFWEEKKNFFFLDFIMWAIFKVFIESVTILILLYILLFFFFWP